MLAMLDPDLAVVGRSAVGAFQKLPTANVTNTEPL
jgi:hypothetical protein